MSGPGRTPSTELRVPSPSHAAVTDPAQLAPMPKQTTFDAIIIGSGFGGTMAAQRFIDAGRTVLMLERGPWVRRGPENWAPSHIGPHTDYCSPDAPFRETQGDRASRIRTFFCVGGPSVFYGGVSLRFRPEDFAPAPDLVADSGAAWPFGLADLVPYYEEAERLLGVSAGPLAETSSRLGAAARSLGLSPARLPLAIRRQAIGSKPGCVDCPTCDGFACAIGAKNDLATGILPRLIARGLVLRSGTVVTQLMERGGAIRAVQAIGPDGRRVEFVGRQVILAAGALGSPHLILASGLQRRSPARTAVGRYLTRHVNSAVVGLFPRRQNQARRLVKQLGFFDHYRSEGGAKLGSIQQLATPPAAYVRAEAPWPLGLLAEAVVDRLLGLLTIAEDQPRLASGLTLDPGIVDRFGMPIAVVQHFYTTRDRWGDDALRRVARRILNAAGAVATYAHPVRTFSHALGTLRMGTDPRTAPVDPDGRFRGLDNLWITDGSALPRSGGVNPSLTIAAMGLRAADRALGQTLEEEEVSHAVG